jgi:hypothetical protein
LLFSPFRSLARQQALGLRREISTSGSRVALYISAATHKARRPDASSRIHRSIRDRDAHQVHPRQHHRSRARWLKVIRSVAIGPSAAHGSGISALHQPDILILRRHAPQQPWQAHSLALRWTRAKLISRTSENPGTDMDRQSPSLSRTLLLFATFFAVPITAKIHDATKTHDNSSRNVVAKFEGSDPEK